jgi:cytochrome P450
MSVGGSRRDPDPAVPTSDVDLWSVENLRGPFAAYAELRALGPVVWLDRLGVFALTRFDAVRGALQDWRTYSADLARRGTWSDVALGTLRSAGFPSKVAVTTHAIARS